jgi:hypothetical protein
VTGRRRRTKKGERESVWNKRERKEKKRKKKKKMNSSLRNQVK